MELVCALHENVRSSYGTEESKLVTPRCVAFRENPNWRQLIATFEVRASIDCHNMSYFDEPTEIWTISHHKNESSLSEIWRREIYPAMGITTLLNKFIKIAALNNSKYIRKVRNILYNYYFAYCIIKIIDWSNLTSSWVKIAPIAYCEASTWIVNIFEEVRQNQGRSFLECSLWTFKSFLFFHFTAK